jgi:DegV family protein with EDD domain
MDSAGDVPESWLQAYDIQVIPVNIHFGEKTYLQGVDLSNKDFYRIVEENGIIPKTSQPSPQQFMDFYRSIATPEDTILSIHVTSKLSGTFDSAEIATRDLSGQYHIYPFDSASGSAAMGYMCKEARLMDRQGRSIQDILRRLDFIRQNINIALTLNTLEYARMSGRVKALQAALASLLNVKPIVALKDGVLDMADRVRTRGRAIDQVVEMIKQRVGSRLINAAVVHAEDHQAGLELMEKVKKEFNCNELIMTELAISVAANLGPGTVGLVAYPVEEGQ